MGITLPSDSKLPAAKPGRRILVVDDSDDAAWALAVQLQLEGYTVDVAQDGRRAIELAERMRPAVIFLDLAMPDMDGFETAWRIRRRSWGRAILLCALTAYDSLEFRERSKQTGFNHHLAKPASWEDLLAVLREASPA